MMPEKDTFRIELRNAKLCIELDCNTIFDAVMHRHCPTCSGSEFYPLEAWLNRDRTARPTRLAALLPGIKIMFMSAYDRDFLVARGLNPGGPVITKPFTIEYLARRVQMVLGESRASASTAAARAR